MFIFAARWIWSQGWKPNPVFDLRGAAVPLLRATVNFRRNPAFNVPSINRQVFRYFSQFHTLSNHTAVSIAVNPAPTNQREPRATPHNAKVWFSETIPSASRGHALAHLRWRFMSLSDNLNQGRSVEG